MSLPRYATADTMGEAQDWPLVAVAPDGVAVVEDEGPAQAAASASERTNSFMSSLLELSIGSAYASAERLFREISGARFGGLRPAGGLRREVCQRLIDPREDVLARVPDQVLALDRDRHR